MVHCFIPRQWRLAKVVYFLIIFEFPFMVANLSLFGIASPNLYRTILWSEGGRMGYNSDPSTVLYAAANYRPVKEPLVWSSFNTQYNLYIGVICTFFWLIKVTGWLLHVCYPILSLPLHLGLMALWAVSIYAQTAPDTIDPKRQNHGAPWYITKSCSVVDDKTIQAYCKQAKSSFAVSIIMLVIYCTHILLAAYSLYPTKEARLTHATKAAEKQARKEKWASSPYDDNEVSPEDQWQHMWELQQLPRTPGAAPPPQQGWEKAPMTPRTATFGQLGGEQLQYRQFQAQQFPQQYSQQVYSQPVAQGNGIGNGNGNGGVEYYGNNGDVPEYVPQGHGHGGKGKGAVV
ncbi:hypothetical protein P280DRAFT_467184 [Massarina eburnea CBS 473.64]|uniref:MARVEL domain-containing protein n=1 Tax=Massarina eburnea CBS 473.64 TaxID=1395130 RepID=A0A6A6S7X2_9PLEO|nr:hypothetical protein P280DRAFT_467184 [Massarina eburnea CBS 473.64]